MSRSRNYQRSRHWGDLEIDPRTRAELKILQRTITDGELEFYDHCAARGRKLIYWTAWAVQRMLASVEPSRGSVSRRRQHRAIKAQNRMIRDRLMSLDAYRARGELRIDFTITVAYPRSIFYTDGI